MLPWQATAEQDPDPLYAVIADVTVAPHDGRRRILSPADQRRTTRQIAIPAADNRKLHMIQSLKINAVLMNPSSE